MRVAYGIEITPGNDQYFQMIERIAAVGEVISTPGSFPVDALPWMRYLPNWFPGAGFKTFAAESKVYLLHVLNQLYTASVDGIVSCLEF